MPSRNETKLRSKSSYSRENNHEKSNMKTISILFLSVTLLACGSASETQPIAQDPGADNIIQLTKQQMKNAGIVVGQPLKKEMTSTLRVTGVIDVPPENKISVSNPFGGFIRKTKLVPGSRVAKGEVIAVMEDPQYVQLQQDYLSSRNRLEFLEADFNRQRDLNSDKSISDKNFQQSRSEYNSQKILVRALEEKLRLISIEPEKLTENTITSAVNIHSPIQGFVSQVNVNVGKYVNPTDVIFELIDERRLYVVLTVFEKDLALASVGQELSISTTTHPEKKYKAVIRTINKSLDTDRSSEIRCDLDTFHEELFPGMFVTAEIQLKRDRVTAVPESAVVNWENKSYVFVEKSEQVYAMTPVETGMMSDGFIELTNLVTNANLVTNNAYSLLMQIKGGSGD